MVSLGQQTAAWESRLLARAHEALENDLPAEPVAVEASLLSQSYRYCEALTRQYSHTFYLASALLPREKRRAVRALYAFCRVSDDLVDQSSGNPQERLHEWQQRSMAIRPVLNDPVALAWADTRARFRVPRRYAEQLIEGISSDLYQNRYSSFEELSAYCYGVACTVGLMAMYIIGFSGPEAIPYALKLGIALQLTNILRDVAEDWRKGRLYLPQDELAAFNLTEDDVAAGHNDARWKSFLRYQIDRNRRFYRQSAPGLAMLNWDGRFAIAAAASLYQAILDDIEAHDSDVFTRRAHVTILGKLRRLPGIWWRSRTVSRDFA